MRILKFRLCDEDRAQYGGEEWVSLDEAKLQNATAKELARIEAGIGQSIQVIVEALRGQTSSTGVAALVWVARYQSGLRTPFADFNIRPLRVDVEIEQVGEVAADGPLDDSPTPSEPSA